MNDVEVQSGSGDATPVVSVVIPTHNRPAWLEHAVQSVLDGEFEDFELIVSNNGDPEHTRRLSERIPDARIRWIERAPCTGPENFVWTLSLARGRYVAVLHDDDWWDPRHLATLVPPLEARADAVVAFADHWIADGVGAVDHDATEHMTDRTARRLLEPGYRRPFYDMAIRESIPFVASVFRREALPPERFLPDVGTALDMWAGYQLALTGQAAYYSPERLVFYRIHEGGDFLTSTMRNLLAAVECQRRMLGEPQFAEHRKDLEWHLAARRQGIGASLLRQGDRIGARAWLGAALRVRLSAKALGAWLATWIAPKSVLARL
jgi:GT2 family glycosyltransferase